MSEYTSYWFRIMDDGEQKGLLILGEPEPLDEATALEYARECVAEHLGLLAVTVDELRENPQITKGKS